MTKFKVDDIIIRNNKEYVAYTITTTQALCKVIRIGEEYRLINYSTKYNNSILIKVIAHLSFPIYINRTFNVYSKYFRKATSIDKLNILI